MKPDKKICWKPSGDWTGPALCIHRPNGDPPDPAPEVLADGAGGWDYKKVDARITVGLQNK